MLEDAWNVWRLKIVYHLFAIFASEDGEQLLSSLYVAMFQFYAKECPEVAENAEVL